MAAVFDIDGVNLVITLDTVGATGARELSVFDIYDELKDWYLGTPVNRRVPFPFVSDGGNPLTSIINQGGYIFLRNDVGWRIKPFEEDGTTYLIGNLAVQDTTLPAFIPTTGDFTAAILGLQPITQGVVPSMQSQLEFNVFNGEVAVDEVSGFAGTGYNGLDPIGTRRAPSSNWTDALAIAQEQGLNKFRVLSSTATITGGDFSSGYVFTADRVQTLLTIQAAADVSNCSLEGLTIQGEVDGLNRIEFCNVRAVTNLSGQLYQSDLEDTVTLVGALQAMDCFSGIAALGYPVLASVGTDEILIRNMRGSLGIADMSGGAHSIGLYGGRLVIEASCTGGTIYLRGEPYEILDQSGGLVTIVDQTEGQKVREIHKYLNLDAANPVDITSSQIAVDDITIDITEPVAGTKRFTRQ